MQPNKSAGWHPENLDLTTCDREPIHIPGSIQPYGVLLVLQPPHLTIVQCSDNTQAVLGIPPEKLLENPIDALIGAENLQTIRDVLQTDGDFTTLNPLPINAHYRAILHHTPGGRLVCELEPTLPEPLDTAMLYKQVQRAIRRMRQADSLATLCAVAAQEIRRTSGFDRVLVYQFDATWNGSVVAEDKQDALETYMNLHFPASDIPRQARALYVQNPIRLIHANDYTPAQMLSVEDAPHPLDMSFAQLRSVSPIHREYMRNMGVSASMSVSVLLGGDLWGLIACHHTTPRIVSYDVRAACELLGQVLAVQIAERTAAANRHRQAHAEQVLTQLVEAMSGQEENEGFVSGLVARHPSVLELVEADGAAVYFGGTAHTLGAAPDADDIAAIADWLQHHTRANVFQTASLARLEPTFTHLKDTVSGLLAICISHAQGDYIFWFRAEQVKSVQWGGDPTKRALDSDGTGRVHPRKSFAAWQEVVALEAVPWQDWEVQIAGRLRTIIVDTVLRLSGELRLRADILSKLNEELNRSNDELDSFAYVASHDLKEPLRGIHNYAAFLLEDYGDLLPDDGTDKLRTLMRLSQRMEALVNALLEFSRVGRLELDLVETDANALVADVLDTLSYRIKETNTTVQVHPLPGIYCDPVRVSEVFANLIANGIKYNDSDAKQIEIGALPPTDNTPGAVTFYVRDNGIGIPAKHHDTIFRVFKRLHGRNRYGGGTGAGLTIVEKIIERHGGRMWLASEVGQGSTFYFTLPGASAR